IYAHLDDVKPSIAKKLEAGKESAYMSKEIGRIWTDAPVELDWAVASIDDIDLAKVAAILERLQFHSLVRRLPVYMQLPTSSPEVVPTSLTQKPWPDTLSIDGPVFIA